MQWAWGRAWEFAFFSGSQVTLTLLSADCTLLRPHLFLRPLKSCLIKDLSSTESGLHGPGAMFSSLLYTQNLAQCMRQNIVFPPTCIFPASGKHAWLCPNKSFLLLSLPSEVPALNHAKVNFYCRKRSYKMVFRTAGFGNCDKSPWTSRVEWFPHFVITHIGQVNLLCLRSLTHMVRIILIHTSQGYNKKKWYYIS